MMEYAMYSVHVCTVATCRDVHTSVNSHISLPMELPREDMLKGHIATKLYTHTSLNIIAHITDHISKCTST